MLVAATLFGARSLILVWLAVGQPGRCGLQQLRTPCSHLAGAAAGTAWQLLQVRAGVGCWRCGAVFSSERDGDMAYCERLELPGPRAVASGP